MNVDTLPGLLGLSNVRFGRAKYIRRNVNVLINVVKESSEFLHSLNKLAVHTTNMSKAWQANKSAKEMAGWPNDLDSAQVRGKSAMEMAGYYDKNSDSIDIVVTRTKKMYPWTDNYTSGEEIELRIHKRDSAKIVDYYNNKIFNE